MTFMVSGWLLLYIVYSSLPLSLSLSTHFWMFKSRRITDFGYPSQWLYYFLTAIPDWVFMISSRRTGVAFTYLYPGNTKYYTLCYYYSFSFQRCFNDFLLFSFACLFVGFLGTAHHCCFHLRLPAFRSVLAAIDPSRILWYTSSSPLTASLLL